MKKLIFVSGKFRDNDKDKQEDNTYIAEVVGSGLIANGFIPVLPMTTFPHYKSIPFLLSLTDKDWMSLYIEPLILHCFALYALPNCEKSTLAPKEIAYATAIGIPVVKSIVELMRLTEK